LIILVMKEGQKTPPVNSDELYTNILKERKEMKN
jgi:hypothetical protein